MTRHQANDPQFADRLLLAMRHEIESLDRAANNIRAMFYALPGQRAEPSQNDVHPSIHRIFAAARALRAAGMSLDRNPQNFGKRHDSMPDYQIVRAGVIIEGIGYAMTLDQVERFVSNLKSH